jgi:hypothetical protein
MTEVQAIEKIISVPKYYIGIMPQSTASLFIKRWRVGNAKQKTIRAFILKFGFEIESESKTTYKIKSNGRD